eukprot:IDg10040t1
MQATLWPVDRPVKVLLLQDIHYLAAAVNPLTPQTDFTDLFEPTTRASRKFLSKSLAFFSAEDLETKSVDERCQMFSRELFQFTSGTSPRFVVGRQNFTARWDLAGFWLTFGKDTPLLQKVGTWISYLSASSCVGECSFRAQNAINTKTRNRLYSQRVRMLMFVRWNLLLFAGYSPDVEDAVEELFRMAEEESEGEESGAE